MTSTHDPATPEFAKAARTIYEVDPGRLMHGRYSNERERVVGEGDIRASYSADTIALKGRIRKPFIIRNRLWVCVGTSGRSSISASAYQITPLSQFNGVATTYEAKTRDSEVARADPDGFYHGMTVDRGGKRLVLVGPPAVFQPGIVEQPGLFPE